MTIYVLALRLAANGEGELRGRADNGIFPVHIYE